MRLDLSAVHHHLIDFEDYWTQDRYDFVAMDPPWYFPGLTDWVNNAATICNRGARIAFPLFGEGTRPGASSERTHILNLCRHIGTVELLPNAVEYEVPNFESSALGADGIFIRGTWRRSDLVVLTVTNPPDSLRSIRQAVEWEETCWGQRLIAVRNVRVAAPPRGGSGLVWMIPDTVGGVLNSVSRRDWRWQFINVWVSDNRVAYTPDIERFRRALSAFTGPTESPDRDGDVRELRDWLEV